MTDTVLAIFLGLALTMTVTTAIGAKCLRHFSHRQLELYCRARRRRELFDDILDHHVQVALTAEKLLIIGVAVLSYCSALEVAPRILPGGAGTVTIVSLLVLVGLLTVTVWIPWAVVRHSSAPFLVNTWWLWRFIHRVFWPIAIGGHVVDSFVRRLSGRPKRDNREEEEEAFEDEIMTMVTAGQRGGLLEEDAREMIEGVIELGDADVSDIMTPRFRVDALDVELSWSEIIELVVTTGRTRLPVYERTLDNIIGVLYVKDLLPVLAQDPPERRQPLRNVLREPWFIPATIPLDDLLQDFLENRKHLAIVVDEYEAVEGVVTIEDVLEEIVGEIIDESDTDMDEGIWVISESKSEVLGSVHVDVVNERLGLDLPESDDFDTMGGFVVNQLRHIPMVGEVVRHNGIRITVQHADPRRVLRVMVEFLDPNRDASASNGR